MPIDLFDKPKSNEPVFKIREPNKDDYLALRQAGLSPLKARLYASRGVKAEQLNMGLKNLLPVSSLTNSMQAGDFLAQAIEDNKKICVVADYDSDGATSAAVMVTGLRELGADVEYVVPDRHKHGYGLSPAVMDEVVNKYRDLADTLPDVIVTVDNGIVAFDGIKRAKEMGMQVVVTDHHLGGEVLPDADVLVNPNQKNCGFKSKAMAGCGVAWYVVCATQKHRKEKFGLHPNANPEFDVRNLLDYVAIGTVADVVPLDNNNRILIDYGLNIIRNGQAHEGVYALMQVADIPMESIKTTDIAFRVAPRINAAGRLDNMAIGIDCLLAQDPLEAQQGAIKLDELNQLRQSKERETTSKAAEQIVAEMDDVDADDMGDKRTIVAAGQGWEEGVVGIVAARLKEKYNRPAIVMSASKEDPSVLKGSARSIAGFHFRDALIEVDRRLPGALVKFGGHAMAAGLTLKADKLDEFKKVFEEVAHELLHEDDLQLTIETDGPLNAADICIENIVDMETGHWGQAFPQPTFNQTMEVVEERQIGADGSHKKMKVKIDNQVFDAVKWRCTDEMPQFINADYTLSINTFRGENNVQIMVGNYKAGQDPRMGVGMDATLAKAEQVQSQLAQIERDLDAEKEDKLDGVFSLSDLNML